MINLTHDTIDRLDIDSLIEWLKGYPRLTQGAMVKEFETRFAESVGSKYALMVNSGSSANLLAASVLQQHSFEKVVVPAICWSTDISPIIQLGMHPIVIDCNLDTLSVDLNELEYVFKSYKPEALFLVSILGIQPEMTEIMQLCEKYNVFLVEDACESFGSTFNGKQLGTFGNIGTYSFYFSHHMSTIEGGMVVTDDEMLHCLMTMMRAHGWDRDIHEEHRAILREKNNVDDFNGKFTFYVTGFNLRATEIQAQIGLSQLARSSVMIANRSMLMQRYKDRLSAKGVWTPAIRNESPDICSGFGWPVLCKNRDALVQSLTNERIESRPLVAGSINKHPMMENSRFLKRFTDNADLIHSHGLYTPIHTGMSYSDVDTICDIIIDNRDKYIGSYSCVSSELRVVE